MPRFLFLASLLSLALLAVRVSVAQENQAVAAAFEMGRVLMGVGEIKVKPEDVPEVRVRAKTYGHDQWLEGRLPLEPVDLIGGERLSLIGDAPYLSQGKAWLMQSASELRKGGVTQAGFEILRADQQHLIDSYRNGKLSRGKLVAALLGDNDVRFKQSRKLAFEETVSAIDALHMAGIRVVALGLTEALEDQAFIELTGRTRKDLKAAGQERFAAAVRDIRAPLEQLQSDFLAVAISDMLRGDQGKAVVLASAGRLSKYSTAGRLADEGIPSRTYGFLFPESGRLNDSLERTAASLRYSQFWAYVPLDRKSAGMDALLLAPAYLQQAQLH